MDEVVVKKAKKSCREFGEEKTGGVFGPGSWQGFWRGGGVSDG